MALDFGDPCRNDEVEPERLHSVTLGYTRLHSVAPVPDADANSYRPGRRLSITFGGACWGRSAGT